MVNRLLDRTRSDSVRAVPCLVLMLTLAVPSAVWAQGGQDQRKILREYQEVNRQLQGIRQQALQDSALTVRRQKLTAYIRSEMKALDDSTAAQVERMMKLREDLQAAQQAQDTAGARSAVRELKKLQRATASARKEVMQRPEIQKRIKAFREALRAEMREVNPRADSLLRRADSLEAELRGGPGGAGG